MHASGIPALARAVLCLALATGCATAPVAQARVAELGIRDRTTGQLLPTYWHQGQAYVVGRPGNEYEVVVRNLTRGDVLAVMSVDGVNVLTGETASPRQGGYVIGPWDRVAVRGWRKSLAQTAAFYFTSPGDSYAARTGRPDDVGVIGVALFARKPAASITPLDVAPPPREKDELAERRKQAAPAASAAPLGTGHGRREDSRAEYVAFERASDTPIETLSIRYDSYRNLVAQGVIPAYGAGPRHPDPFPGAFVADPGPPR